MNLGKWTRLQRIFSHPSGKLCSVAVDHFVGYQAGLPAGLRNLPQMVNLLASARPDAVTMHKGAANATWRPHAGKIPLIVSSVCFTPDDAMIEVVATVEEALLLGADAIAVAIGVRGPNEGRFLKILTNAVEQGARWNLPVIAHIYPRDFSGVPKIVHDPENILWAVRCGVECGADVIKAPFTGDVASYREIVASSTAPVIAAGGPKCETLEEALELIELAVSAGARGATLGRNVWGDENPVRALRAFQRVIHDGLSAAAALEAASLSTSIANNGFTCEPVEK
jgi:class I fructose-bisphosphate aldolase